jgi:hypothetical protein
VQARQRLEHQGERRPVVARLRRQARGDGVPGAPVLPAGLDRVARRRLV